MLVLDQMNVHMKILVMKVNLMIVNIVFMMEKQHKLQYFIEFEKIQLLQKQHKVVEEAMVMVMIMIMNGNGSSDNIINGINVSR